MRNRWLSILLIVAAGVVTAPAKAWDGPYQPDNQRVPYSNCEAMGDGSYFCDGGGGLLEDHCTASVTCTAMAVQAYNASVKKCSAINDPVTRSNCYDIAEITFNSATQYCTGFCPH